MFVCVLEDENVETSGMLLFNFLHTNETVGLCTAYLVMTSTIRLYSSLTLLRALRLIGTLKKRSSAYTLN